jgi:hypothetical protein
MMVCPGCGRALVRRYSNISTKDGAVPIRPLTIHKTARVKHFCGRTGERRTLQALLSIGLRKTTSVNQIERPSEAHVVWLLAARYIFRPNTRLPLELIWKPNIRLR